MSYFPDLGNRSFMVTGNYVRAVGWLGAVHEFPKGEVEGAFFDRLRVYSAKSRESTAALGWPAFGGFHTCELCRRADGTANFGVPHGTVLFVAPEMIVHYVEAHDYLPPNEFMTAVLKAPLPGTQEYAAAVKPFRWRGPQG